MLCIFVNARFSRSQRSVGWKQTNFGYVFELQKRKIYVAGLQGYTINSQEGTDRVADRQKNEIKGLRVGRSSNGC